MHHKSCGTNCIPYPAPLIFLCLVILWTARFPALQVKLQHVQYCLSNQDTGYNGFLRTSDALTVSVQQSPLHSLLTGVSWS